MKVWIATIAASVALIFSANHAVYAAVAIADELKIPVPMPSPVPIRAGKFEVIPILVRDALLLSVSVSLQNKMFPDLSVYVCDEDSLQRLTRNLPNGCRGVRKGRGTINIDFPVQTQSSSHYLVLDNRYALMVKKTAAVEVMATVRIPDELSSQFLNNMGKFQRGLIEMFDVPDFEIGLRPCGEANAFSKTKNGDITFCSELYFSLIADRLAGAATAVLLHEISHTLLNLWNLPNWDNEETADEFAMVMLFWGGQQQSALDWIASFSKHDSQQQAAYQIQNGDRHPLSVQRVRNIKRILDNPRPVIQRWNNLVYPRMSEKGLRDVIDNPGAYGDRELATWELEKRATMKLGRAEDRQNGAK